MYGSDLGSGTLDFWGSQVGIPIGFSVWGYDRTRNRFAEALMPASEHRLRLGVAAARRIERQAGLVDELRGQLSAPRGCDASLDANPFL